MPAPVRSGTINIELPPSLDKKMKLQDFHFLKVVMARARARRPGIGLGIGPELGLGLGLGLGGQG